jgi:transcriptional regulator with XRE-family HTH domain
MTGRSEYARAVGARLREVRTQQGLSLNAVERKSHGRWKAPVLGSYERGDRSVTVQKLAELAEFYGVPVSGLLPQETAAEPDLGSLLIAAGAAGGVRLVRQAEARNA